VDELMALGWGVQLKHIEKETTWEEHGFVTVKNSEGTELATSDKLQHNRNFGKKMELSKELAAKVGSPMQQGAIKDSAPEESEGSTKQPSDDGTASL